MTICNEVIVSRQNKIVSAVAALDNRKTRESEGLFRFDGGKLFLEAVSSGVKIRRILLQQSISEKWFSVIRDCETELSDASVSVLSDGVFSRLSDEQSPEGILCVAERPAIHAMRGEPSLVRLSEIGRDTTKRILLLESVRDPGNVGTILRSALAFGCDLLVLSSDCADLFNPKTVRGAMGALFRLPTATFADIREAVGCLRSYDRRVFGAALDRTALPLGKNVFRRGDCVIVGNEGHGLSPETLAACDRSLFIPMEPYSESLNAAVAASVILWSLYAEL